MITVTLYGRSGCHLCEVVKAELIDLQATIPHQLVEVDLDQDAKARKAYGESIPVVKIGPYTLKAPIERQELQIALGAAQRGQEHDEMIDQAALSTLKHPEWTRADGFSLWLSRHYLAFFNALVFIYVGLPFLAPVLEKVGITGPAGAIYRIYGAVCHQLAYRSFFLFGQQPFYPRALAGVAGYSTFEQATGIDSQAIWTARQFIGNNILGYKVALCERDVAIYGGMLLFGLLFAFLSRRIFGLPWYLWIVIALVPIGLDGFSQLISQLGVGLLPLRESTPFLRVLTGFLFGFSTAWFGYPLVEETMAETRAFLQVKRSRLKTLVSS